MITTPPWLVFPPVALTPALTGGEMTSPSGSESLVVTLPLTGWSIFVVLISSMALGGVLVE